MAVNRGGTSDCVDLAVATWPVTTPWPVSPSYTLVTTSSIPKVLGQPGNGTQETVVDTSNFPQSRYPVVPILLGSTSTCRSSTPLPQAKADSSLTPSKRKKEVIKKIFENEIEEIISDDGFTALLDVLEPDQEIATEGNSAAHDFTLEQAAFTTKNASLVNVVKILDKGRPASSMIGDAAKKTSNHNPHDNKYIEGQNPPVLAREQFR